MPNIEILYEDTEIIVVNKPAGLPCHPLPDSRGETLIERLAQHFPEVLHAFEGDREGGLCHRIDNDTSGVVVVARNSQIKQKWRGRFKAGLIEKTYLALVSGLLGQEVVIETAIAHHQKNKSKMVALIHSNIRYRSQPQEATTTGRPILQSHTATVLRVKIVGGRRHQIRVHFASIGHPLIGDVLYKGEKAMYLQGHALHASTITLPSGQVIEAPCPNKWEPELVRLGLVDPA